MTIRFSAARRGTNATVARAMSLCAWRDPANDNADDSGRKKAFARPARSAREHDMLARTAAALRPSPFDLPIVPDALRHFARHGLSAALHARLEAEAAQAGGDAVASTRWLAICRQFDRRMADATARSFERMQPSNTPC